MMHLPESVDLRISGRCDLACPYCFGPRHDLDGRLDDFLELISNLARHGTRSIVVTGGEPLLVKRLPELLGAASELGLVVVLSTNGRLLGRRHADVLPYVDWLSLPLDSPIPWEQGMLRPSAANIFEPDGESAIEVAIAALRLVDSKYSNIKVKLGSVATRLNAESLPGIPSFVASRGLRPDVWKVYRVSRSSYAEDVWTSISLESGAFQRCIDAARLEAEQHGWNLVTWDEKSRDRAYLFCEPNGSAMTVIKGREVVIGNMFGDFDGVVARWNRHVDERKLSDNYDRTYPTPPWVEESTCG